MGISDRVPAGQKERQCAPKNPGEPSCSMAHPADALMIQPMQAQCPLVSITTGEMR